MNKLNQNIELKTEYNKIIDEYLSAGIIEKIDEPENVNVGEVHYLTYMAVCRDDTETTKTQIVFNGSLRNGNEPSLNDALYSGPCLLPDLYDILIRFRIVKIAVVSDIKQAFLQI